MSLLRVSLQKVCSLANDVAIVPMFTRSLFCVHLLESGQSDEKLKAYSYCASYLQVNTAFTKKVVPVQSTSHQDISNGTMKTIITGTTKPGHFLMVYMTIIQRLNFAAEQMETKTIPSPFQPSSHFSC